MKCINEVVEQTASVDIDLKTFTPVMPPYGDLPPEGIYCRPGRLPPLRDEQLISEFKLPLVHEFVRANTIDREVIHAGKPRLGIVAAGKSYADTRQALGLLELDETKAAEAGISLYKIGCIWPLEPEGVSAFAAGQDILLVVEEKESFLEAQLAAILVNQSRHPRLVGKRDEEGQPLFSTTLQIDPAHIAIAIVDRLDKLGLADNALMAARARLSGAPAIPPTPRVMQPDALPTRMPYFCSGCPHNRSTRVPEGSLSMTGIGCHTMALLAPTNKALVPTQMGGEGGNWLVLAPFTKTSHMFQNMGDGTYYHSGLMAIRAAVAAGVNITYKILYNDAVAMTGGQPVDGPISVAEIAQQVRREGVNTIILMSDNPDSHRGNPDLPPPCTHRASRQAG